MTDTFPRQQARTRLFTLGAPRSFQVSPDGARIAFLRSKGGTDPITCLWVLDLTAGADGQAGSSERLVADPALIGGRQEEPEAEKARRERSRESASGVVAFATDAGFTMAAFALAGQVYTTSLAADGPGPVRTSAQSPAIDPRPDPTGQRVAYVCDGYIRLTDLRTGADTALIGPTLGEEISYGLAEYLAAEEMGRHRGYWWAPDGTALLVARVDSTSVGRWQIADPANPDRRPVQVRYPSAGTANANVALLLAGIGGETMPVSWDADACPYLVTADWDTTGPMIVVQSRDQRLMRLLAVDVTTGQTSLLREDTDPHWLDIISGVPARTSDGLLVWTTIADGATRLLVADPAALANHTAVPVTPNHMQVREVLSVDGNTVLFAASLAEPTEVGVWAYGPGGLRVISTEGIDGQQPGRPLGRGVDTAVMGGDTAVLTTRSVAEPGAVTHVLRPGRGAAAGAEVVAAIGSLAERPIIGTPRVEFLRAGRRELRTALVLPSWYEAGSARLPVLMDPYGGPHGQRVLASADSYLTPQWFADQGFAVVVADGRGTPGRGPDWDRMIAGDLATFALDDQVDALAAVAEHCDRTRLADLDLTKVGMRGWSFGGYLSALAVLRRPDVFAAGIAGAPVTDWRLYDTHYTERYLGHPDEHPDAYDRCSLLTDAHKLSRPLMMIHGLADDNVVVAHTLRLSSALLAAGRPHSVLPLTGVTHLASQEEVAENLLLLQVAFLRSALAVSPHSPPGR